MRELEVGAIIGSILAAFESGRDILRQTEGQRHSKRPSKTPASAASTRVHESLSRGSEKIRSCYEQNVVLHGQRYVAGDVLAKTQLARILFNLNTGFLAITNLLSIKSTKTRALMKQNLLGLSDGATAETLDVLDALHQRLSLALASDLRSKANTKATRSIVPEQKSLSGSPRVTKPTTSDAEPNLLLVRGGWVRTKSGASIKVSAADARRRAARKTDKKRASAEDGCLLASPKVVDQIAETPSSLPNTQNWPVHKCGCESTEVVPQVQHLVNKQALQLPSNASQRPPSLYIVPSDFFRNEDMVGDLPPARPPKIPLHTRPNPNMRPRPLSGATFLTASTKIGEIPENKLPDRVLSKEEDMLRPMPYTIPPLLSEVPKRKRKGFWLFKRPALTVP